jgi:hypothetical protein
MTSVAAEFSDALGRKIKYVDVPFEQWRDRDLGKLNLPPDVSRHLLTMARLHAANRYDRTTHDLEELLGRPATTIREFVARRSNVFEQAVRR